MRRPELQKPFTEQKLATLRSPAMENQEIRSRTPPRQESRLNGEFPKRRLFRCLFPKVPTGTVSPYPSLGGDPASPTSSCSSLWAVDLCSTRMLVQTWQHVMVTSHTLPFSASGKIFFSAFWRYFWGTRFGFFFMSPPTTKDNLTTKG